MNCESEKVEFKSRVTDEIYREVVAFANTDGGVVYVGVDDGGNVVGLDDVDEEYTRLTNGIRDAIAPDVTMFVKFTLQDDRVVRIDVREGSRKPYYLKGKGLKPSGVYVRQGASSAQASFERIRSMIKWSDGDVFEVARSMEQSLTFDAATDAFGRRGVEFGSAKFRALSLAGAADGLFTNLAMLVSDQCVHTTKIAVFADDANTEIADTKEFHGSIFRQTDEAFAYLCLANRTRSRIIGLERLDSPDYPAEAVREALLNAVVHRDYAFSGSIIININDRETEFVSIGGLPPGITQEDICNGISQPRNPRLAEVFHRLGLIESYGTGIRRIFRLYEKCPLQPRIEVTPNTFKMVLPNMNHAMSAVVPATVAERQRHKVVGHLAVHGSISVAEAQSLLGLKRTRAYLVLKRMCADGLLAPSERGVYVLR